MLGTIQIFCACPFPDSHDPFVRVLVGFHWTDEQIEAQSEHATRVRYYYCCCCSFKDPTGLSLSLSTAHRAADECVAVAPEEQGLRFEEKTGNPFPGRQRNLP